MLPAIGSFHALPAWARCRGSRPLVSKTLPHTQPRDSSATVGVVVLPARWTSGGLWTAFSRAILQRHRYAEDREDVRGCRGTSACIP